MTFKCLLLLFCFLSSVNLHADDAIPDEVHADDYITIAGLNGKVLSKAFKNSHIKIIGVCVFTEGTWFPKLHFTTEIEQLLPDLVVSVYNRKDSNPWYEVKKMYESSLDRKGYKVILDKLSSEILGTRISSGEGNSATSTKRVNSKNEQTRIVDVIGSPASLLSLPFITHRSSTTPYGAYYLSQIDEFMDRTVIAESTYMVRHPWLTLHSPIGTEASLWGSEIPRIMRVNTPYRFRASVVAAMHAADIATNNHFAHIKMPASTNNSCGKNCAVSSVTFDPTQKNIIWQEVFPKNRNVLPGEDGDLGLEDDRKGKGNYVFVIWRKYRGCIQAPGKFSYASVHVPETVKR